MPFREDLLNPIPGDNPSGISLRFDPVTDKIKEARREDTEMPQGQWKTTLKVADYGQVIQLASEAIAKKGKDLQIAVFLADAHIRREGFAAAAPGFRFLHDLLDQFWDTVYPVIEDGDAEMRAAPLEWLGNHLPTVLRNLPITSNKMTWISHNVSRMVGYEDSGAPSEKRAQRQQLISEGKPTGEEWDQAVQDTPKAFCENLAAQLSDAQTSLGALIDLCDAKFGDVSPSFVKTRTALDEIAHLVDGFIKQKGGPAPVAAAPVVVEPAPAAAAAAAAAASAPAPVAAPAPPRIAQQAFGAEPTSREEAAAMLAATARYLRSKDVYDIAPYLILRGFRWGEIRYNGPEVDVSMLEAPPPEVRKDLKQAALDSDWDGILQITETAMELPCGRAWLDLQRYTVKALESKGEYFKFVADAVRTGVRGLLQDLPGLENRTLTDDTPVANAETLTWIRTEVMTVADQPAPPPVEAPAAWAPVPAPVPAAPPMTAPPDIEESKEEAAAADEAFQQAMEAAGAGRIGEAAGILTNELGRARSGRSRFTRRMQLAHILVAGGRERVAYPILQSLAEEIENRGLEEWELGEVVAHPLALLFKCLTALEGDDEQRKAIYNRICRLDPRQALEAGE